MLNAMNTQEQYNYCRVVGCTDIGRKRKANEDSMGTRETKNGLVAVVCDGMGGHVGGAIASRMAVDTVLDFLDNVYQDDPRVAIGEAIDAANLAILKKTAEQPELTGMGSTCVLLLVRDGKVYIGHVGDSRVYLVRNRHTKQLTKDHSFVQMLVDMGELSPEEAEHHPRKNEITNALGIPEMKPATILPDAILPEAGDCFVLCSDGLSGMVSDQTIGKVVSRQAEMRTQERADELVRLANENGGVDNITVQLVEFSITPNRAKSKKTNKTLLISLIALLAVLIGIGTYWGTSALTKAPLPHENLNLGDVPFKKDKDVVKIEFKNGKTVISLIDTTEQWTEKWSGELMTLNVIKVNNKVASLMKSEEGNFADLKWKTPDTLIFEMTGAEKMYVFKVWPQKEQQKGQLMDEILSGSLQKPNAEEKGTEKETKEKSDSNHTETEQQAQSKTESDAIDVFTAKAPRVTYSANFEYKKNESFLTFQKNSQNEWKIIPNIGNESMVNQSFEVNNINTDESIKYEKKSDNEYTFSFTDKEPSDEFIIEITGKTQSELSKEPEIYVIEIKMTKKQ